MNKRIREILTQCQQESIDGPEYPHWTDFEKFAELIVREAAELVKSAQITKDGHTWRSADYAVLEHFGVER